MVYQWLCTPVRGGIDALCFMTDWIVISNQWDVNEFNSISQQIVCQIFIPVQREREMF